MRIDPVMAVWGEWLRDRVARAELQVKPDAAALASTRKGPAYELRSGVAIIDVSGPMIADATSEDRFYGYIDYQDVTDALDQAASDPDVNAALLVMNSPGGSVIGLDGAVDAVARFPKPLHTYARGMMASAAYWVGIGSQRVSASPQAIVGSIGVILGLYDYSGLFERMGIKATTISSGELKGTVIGDRLPAGQIASMQGMVDGYSESFNARVGAQRRLSAERVQELATGEAWQASRAPEGLIDGVGTFAEALAAVKAAGAGNRNRAQGARHAAAACGAQGAGNQSTHMEITMSTIAGAGAAAAQSDGATERRSDEGQNAKPAQPQRVAATIAELKAAYPGEPEFVLAQVEKGATALEAKAAFADVLQARLTAEREKNAGAIRATPRPKLNDVGGAERGAAGAESGDAERDFRDEFNARLKDQMQKGKPEGQARMDVLRSMAAEKPELYQAYLQSRNRRRNPKAVFKVDQGQVLVTI